MFSLSLCLFVDLLTHPLVAGVALHVCALGDGVGLGLFAPEAEEELERVSVRHPMTALQLTIAARTPMAPRPQPTPTPILAAVERPVDATAAASAVADSVLADDVAEDVALAEVEVELTTGATYQC